MLEHMKTFGKTHIFYIILIVVGVVAFRSWLTEHDARMKADLTVTQKEAEIKTLQAHQVATDVAAAQQVKIITKVVHDAVTPSQVVAALPQVDPQVAANLVAHVVAGDPAAVQVNATALMGVVGDLKISQVQLGACLSDLTDEKTIVGKKDEEIVALKKKPGFWARVKSHGKWAIGGMLVLEGAKIYLTGKP